MLIFYSCSDDQEQFEMGYGSCQITVLSDTVFDCEKRYYTIEVEPSGFPEGMTIDISTDSKWLELDTDTLPVDGKFDVYVNSNDTSEARVGEILFTSAADPTCSASICVMQNGEIGYEGTTVGTVTRRFGIGYGYSVFDEYMNSKSLKGQIINETGLKAYEKDNTYSIIQENKRGKEALESLSAYSLAELSTKLMENSSASVGVPGFRKTVKRHVEILKHQTDVCYYGYARLFKVVASRNMDVAAMLDVCKNAGPDKLCNIFSDDFYEIYRKILDASGDGQKEYIHDMIEKFGTHIVFRASIGGCIDYAFTINKNNASNLETSALTEASQTFGKTKTNSSQSQKLNILSSNRSNMSFSVSGGSKETVKALQNEISGMNAEKGFSPNALSDWLGSISVNELDTLDAGNLDIIDFSFIPIWELFYGDLRQAVQGVILDMAKEEKNRLNLAEIGLDNYKIAINTDMFSFDDASSDASLVRVVSVNDEPMLEVCNEYVPAVRTDKRITVCYPIKQGLTSTARGLFPGDGHTPPAMLSFSGGKVYVNPIDGYSCGDVLDTIYYMHGTLYYDPLNIAFLDADNLSMKEHRLKFKNSESGISYPVVKIGSGYWTRRNIRKSMDWVFDGNKKCEFINENNGNMLYAATYACNSPFFFSSNKTLYSHLVNNNGERERWFMPSITDCNQLTEYIGHNHKALFLNQQSGLDLEFAGCYGPYYILAPDMPANKGSWDTPKATMMYENKYSFLSFKDVRPTTYINGSSLTISEHIKLITGAKLLVMDQDYEWKLVDYNDKVKTMKFPVRLFRTSYYNYLTSGI